jgi:hypothetical protein
MWKVIGYTSENRQSTYAKLTKAITRAIAKLSTHTKLPAQTPHGKSTATKCDNADIFRNLLLENFGSASHAFDTFKSDDGILGRKLFKRLVAKLGMEIDDSERKVKIEKKSAFLSLNHQFDSLLLTTNYYYY